MVNWGYDVTPIPIDLSTKPGQPQGCPRARVHRLPVSKMPIDGQAALGSYEKWMPIPRRNPLTTAAATTPPVTELLLVSQDISTHM